MIDMINYMSGRVIARNFKCVAGINQLGMYRKVRGCITNFLDRFEVESNSTTFPVDIGVSCFQPWYSKDHRIYANRGNKEFLHGGHIREREGNFTATYSEYASTGFQDLCGIAGVRGNVVFGYKGFMNKVCSRTTVNKS